MVLALLGIENMKSIGSKNWVSAPLSSFRLSALSLVAMTVVLAACGGGGGNKDKPASQTAAKVNKEEITVHQINFVLQQQRGLQPAQAASASRQALERLIDQEVVLQKAEEQKVDRDPRVVQQVEAARRDIISRAYLEKLGAQAPKPSADEVKAYYEKNPALFKERKVYNLQEIAIEAKPDQIPALRTKLEGSKNVAEFVEYLKASGFKYAANQATRAAEQLPLTAVNEFAKVKDGQALFNTTANGAQVVIVAASRSQPVDETRATPAIEQFLFNDRKRQVVEDDLKALRGAAKIEYVGDYARTPAEAAAAKAAAASANEVKPTISPLTATPASAIEPIVPVPAASIPSGTNLDKGLQGLK
ncbi:MAG: peptidyl-prolyl cis-trans isomerase, EpsD family [Rhizobacter sp.]|nr:peptidyl-prolyl cis-trans isomerase, EpsD family [Rhizobacter sp.]